MTIKELRDKIVANHGELKLDTVTMKYDGNEGDIDMYVGLNLIAWVNGEDDDSVNKMNLCSGNINQIDGLCEIAEFIGINVTKKDTKFPPLVVNQSDTHTKGMVEAYEKILLTKKITIE